MIKRIITIFGILGLVILPYQVNAAITTPISFWNFNESSGAAADSAGSVTLTNNGTLTYSAGKLNNAANPSSTGPKYFSAVDPNTFDFSGSYSFAGWIKFSSFSTNNKIINKWNNTGNQRGFELELDNPGTTVLFDKSPDGVADDFKTISWSPSLDTYYCLASTFNSGTKAWKLYVDATQQGTTQTMTSATTFANTAPLGVGARGSDAAQPVNGQMDAWGAWNVELTSSEVTEFCNGGTGREYPFASPVTPPPFLRFE